MFWTTVIASVIAALAGGVTYYAWKSDHKPIAALTAVVCAISASIAVVFAFLGAVALFLRIIPILLLALGVWLMWKVFTGGFSKSGTTSQVG
ncbi:hypothetical protein [Corynebacterium alimapuense]|uniref:Uncharacterized protein n=1 Tax=Corynebacterium alimapuense TaxID=1576874 RepID=A0A3M8KB23_9CORY|nr:hypothetical protein [Corynebacterium alimapuense]RNE49658.1 hypothetical protein C5L39_04805 [Corynebacterium alimapuense]